MEVRPLQPVIRRPAVRAALATLAWRRSTGGAADGRPSASLAPFPAMARRPTPLQDLAERLPGRGVVVRHAVAQLERSLAPGERPVALYTGLRGDAFGVLLVTDQRVAFVEWTNERRTDGALHE